MTFPPRPKHLAVVERRPLVEVRLYVEYRLTQLVLHYFQVEMVLDMEETVPESFAKRANVKKHVEYPNRNSSKVF